LFDQGWAMSRVLQFLMVMFALLAVAMPSVTLGARGLVEHPAPVLQLRAEGGYVKARCPLSGTGRLLACSADVGVMPARQMLMPARSVAFLPSMIDAMPEAFAAEPGLPPPRQG
jgi:hypothetical protein